MITLICIYFNMLHVKYRVRCAVFQNVHLTIQRMSSNGADVSPNHRSKTLTQKKRWFYIFAMNFKSVF
jgi:hypothetical protein